MRFCLVTRQAVRSGFEIVFEKKYGYFHKEIPDEEFSIQAIHPNQHICIGFTTTAKPPTRWFITTRKTFKNVPYLTNDFELQEQTFSSKQNYTIPPTLSKAFSDLEQELVDFLTIIFHNDLILVRPVGFGCSVLDDGFLEEKKVVLDSLPMYFWYSDMCLYLFHYMWQKAEKLKADNFADAFLHVYASTYTVLNFLGLFNHPQILEIILDCFWIAWYHPKFQSTTWLESLTILDVCDCSLLSNLLKHATISDIGFKQIRETDPVWTLFRNAITQDFCLTYDFVILDDCCIFPWYIFQNLFGVNVLPRTLPLKNMTIFNVPVHQIMDCFRHCMTIGVNYSITKFGQLANTFIDRIFCGFYLTNVEEQFKFCAKECRPYITSLQWMNAETLEIELNTHVKSYSRRFVSKSCIETIFQSFTNWKENYNDEYEQPSLTIIVNFYKGVHLNMLCDTFYYMQCLQLGAYRFVFSRQALLFCLLAQVDTFYFLRNPKLEELFKKLNIPQPSTKILKKLRKNQTNRTRLRLLCIVYWFFEQHLHDNQEIERAIEDVYDQKHNIHAFCVGLYELSADTLFQNEIQKCFEEDRNIWELLLETQVPERKIRKQQIDEGESEEFEESVVIDAQNFDLRRYRNPKLRRRNQNRKKCKSPDSEKTSSNSEKSSSSSGDNSDDDSDADDVRSGRRGRSREKKKV